MKSFGELNGDNLIQVGKGIAAISAAMIAMGASSVVSGIGGMLGSLAEGITGLFGGKTPFDKLQEFSKLNIDAPKVEANANAVVAYSKAMAALGAGGTVGAIGGLVTNVVESLVSFFGGDTQIPWGKIQTFQSYSLDADKIKANAEAVTAFGRAMSSLPTISSGRSGGLIGSVAEFFLGAEREQLPWAQLVSFGRVQLPTASIKANAEAMAAFGDALSKVPAVNRERTGGLMDGITSFFVGSRNGPLPWDNLKAFGELQINATGVKANAEAMAAFGNALSAFRGGAAGSPPVVSQELITNLGRLGAVGSTGALQQTAAGLQAIASVQNLQTTLSSLNALDATKLVSYNTALKDLTKVLADLNKELSNENRGGLFGMGEAKANAGDILKNISVNTSTGAGNTGQLNDTLMKVFEVLQQTKEINDKIEKNTKRGVGADVANRDVTAF